MVIGSRRQTVDSNGAGSGSEIVPRMAGGELAVKRAIDLTLTLLSMPLVLPISLIVGILIKLDSKGPVLYSQTRVGKGGKTFRIYKFRSMRQGAEELRPQLQQMNEADGPVFKIRHDPRVTRIGAFLRKSSLDELPQLINILKGDMSIVGPRPPLPDEVEQYTPHQRGRLAVKPGLTCLWQISGRSNVDFDTWVELDLKYIRTQSIWLDIKIICMTLPAVLKGSGAW